MNRQLPIAVLLATALLTMPGCNRNATDTVAGPVVDNPIPAAASEAELIARGEYMVRMGGCNDCHTPDYADKSGEVPKEQWLTGSPIGFSGPWGTTYPANLRLEAAGMDEAAWLKYSGELHSRPIMPDYQLRAMHEDDRRAAFRFIKALGTAGQPAPAYLPPGQKPTAPYWKLVLPPGPPPKAPAAS